MARKERIYSANATGVTVTTVSGDNTFVLLGGGNQYVIHEIRVWQTGTTTLTMEEIIIERGIGAAIGNGTGVTEYENDVDDNVQNTMYVWGTTSVEPTPITFEIRGGWNMLQEWVWLPTPDIQLFCQGTDDIGISFESTTAHTNVGCQITWQEF